MSKPIYVGSGWESKFGVNISVKKDKIASLPTNKYGDIMLEVTVRREPDSKSGATHAVKVNTYQYDKLGIPLESVGVQPEMGAEHDDF